MPTIAMRLSLMQFVLTTLLAALALAGSGCSTLHITGEEDRLAKLLPPARMSPDSVTLELVFMRVPARNENLHEKLWDEVDEQQLPLELRRRLLGNGIRSGVIGTQLPTALSELLAPEPGEEDGPPQATEAWQESRSLQIKPGDRGEIIASGIYPQLTPLFSEEGRISGCSRQQAQCIFALETYPQPDGRVKIQLTPEVHYGQAHQRYVGSGRVYRLEAGRDRDTYDTLRLECLLSPGESLLLSATPASVGLGQCFFVDAQSQERRLLLVRLAQTQTSDLYTPLEVPEEGVE